MAQNTTYNGWKNYQTWNVALWIGNDEPLYREAVDYARRTERPTYRGFIAWVDLRGTTPDGAAWLGRKLDYPRLDEMIRELA